MDRAGGRRKGVRRVMSTWRAGAASHALLGIRHRVSSSSCGERSFSLPVAAADWLLAPAWESALMPARVWFYRHARGRYASFAGRPACGEGPASATLHGTGVNERRSLMTRPSRPAPAGSKR